MASPDLINGIARELLKQENLSEAVAWLEKRISIHMESGDTEAVICVGKLRDRVRAAIAKADTTATEPKKGKGK